MKPTEKAAVTELTAFFANTKKAPRILVNARNFHSISYRYEGKITVEAGGASLVSDAGCITYVPCGVSYHSEILEDGRMAVVHFKTDRDIAFRNPSVRSIRDPEIPALFERLIRAYRVDAPVDFACMAIFYTLLARLEGLEVADGAQVPAKIRAVREYIERNYADPALYIEGLADRFGVSTSYLRREFVHGYGTTPIAFLRAVRIGNAKNMLASGYLPIAEIAEQCGFSGTSYFIQVFHRVVGESPDRYRRRLKE